MLPQVLPVYGELQRRFPRRASAHSSLQNVSVSVGIDGLPTKHCYIQSRFWVQASYFRSGDICTRSIRIRKRRELVDKILGTTLKTALLVFKYLLYKSESQIPANNVIIIERASKRYDIQYLLFRGYTIHPPEVTYI